MWPGPAFPTRKKPQPWYHPSDLKVTHRLLIPAKTERFVGIVVGRYGQRDIVIVTHLAGNRTRSHVAKAIYGEHGTVSNPNTMGTGLPPKSHLRSAYECLRFLGCRTVDYLEPAIGQFGKHRRSASPTFL